MCNACDLYHDKYGLLNPFHIRAIVIYVKQKKCSHLGIVMHTRNPSKNIHVCLITITHTVNVHVCSYYLRGIYAVRTPFLYSYVAQRILHNIKHVAHV